MSEKSKRELEKELSEKFQKEIKLIDKDDKFNFGCTQCGKCCTRDAVESIILKGYDIYKLCNGLDMKIYDFLYKYTEGYIGPSSGLPLFRMKVDRRDKCPFLKRNKCSVHEFKPNVCDSYPLGKIQAKDKFYYILQATNCGTRNATTSPREWIPQIEQSDKIFKLEQKLLGKICDKYNMFNLTTVVQKYPDITQVLSEMYNMLANFLYCFELKADYVEQLEERVVDSDKFIDSLLGAVRSALVKHNETEALKVFDNEVVRK